MEFHTIFYILILIILIVIMIKMKERSKKNKSIKEIRYKVMNIYKNSKKSNNGERIKENNVQDFLSNITKSDYKIFTGEYALKQAELMKFRIRQDSTIVLCVIDKKPVNESLDLRLILTCHGCKNDYLYNFQAYLAGGRGGIISYDITCNHCGNQIGISYSFNENKNLYYLFICAFPETRIAGKPIYPIGISVEIDPYIDKNDPNYKLYLAIINGELEKVNELISQGTNINQQNENENGRTPLFTACECVCPWASSSQNHEKIVLKLLEAGADPNITDNAGNSPLMEIALRRDADDLIVIAQNLISYGAEVNLESNNSGYALMPVVITDNKKFAQLLMENGADPYLIPNVLRNAQSDEMKEILLRKTNKIIEKAKNLRESSKIIIRQEIELSDVPKFMLNKIKEFNLDVNDTSRFDVYCEKCKKMLHKNALDHLISSTLMHSINPDIQTTIHGASFEGNSLRAGQCPNCGNTKFVLLLFDTAKETKSKTNTTKSHNERKATTISPTSNQILKDASGIIYKTRLINGNVWMIENFRLKIAGCWPYDNNETYVKKYGRLYDWNQAMKLCPQGWHLPSNEEWKNLIMYFGEKPVLKMLDNPNSIFDIKKAGIRGSKSYDFRMEGIDEFSWFWTSDEYGNNGAYFVGFGGTLGFYDWTEDVRYDTIDDKLFGLSVRYVKDK